LPQRLPRPGRPGRRPPPDRRLPGAPSGQLGPAALAHLLAPRRAADDSRRAWVRPGRLPDPRDLLPGAGAVRPPHLAERADLVGPGAGRAVARPEGRGRPPRGVAVRPGCPDRGLVRGGRAGRARPIDPLAPARRPRPVPRRAGDRRGGPGRPRERRDPGDGHAGRVPDQPTNLPPVLAGGRGHGRVAVDNLYLYPL